jgi:hypothetical protein
VSRLAKYAFWKRKLVAAAYDACEPESYDQEGPGAISKTARTCKAQENASAKRERQPPCPECGVKSLARAKARLLWHYKGKLAKEEPGGLAIPVQWPCIPVKESELPEVGHIPERFKFGYVALAKVKVRCLLLAKSLLSFVSESKRHGTNFREGPQKALNRFKFPVSVSYITNVGSKREA